MEDENFRGFLAIKEVKDDTGLVLPESKISLYPSIIHVVPAGGNGHSYRGCSPVHVLLHALMNSNEFYEAVKKECRQRKMTMTEVTATFVDYSHHDVQEDGNYLYAPVIHMPYEVESTGRRLEARGGNITWQRLPPSGIVRRDDTGRLMINPRTGLPIETISGGTYQDERFGNVMFHRLEKDDGLAFISLDYSPLLYLDGNPGALLPLRWRMFDINAQGDPRSRYIGSFGRRFETAE